MFGRKNEPAVGCGFLTRSEIGALLEGSLDPTRVSHFERHQNDGCAECLHLDVAVRSFRDILDNGALDVEKSRFERTERPLIARLRRELEERGERRSIFELPWGSGLTSEELEQIAAAGPCADTDPDFGDGSRKRERNE